MVRSNKQANTFRQATEEGEEIYKKMLDIASKLTQQS